MVRWLISQLASVTPLSPMWDTCLAHRLPRHPNTAAIRQPVDALEPAVGVAPKYCGDPQYFLKMNGEVAHMGGADEPRVPSACFSTNSRNSLTMMSPIGSGRAAMNPRWRCRRSPSKLLSPGL